MTQYMLSVHHTGPDDPAFHMSPEDMQATFEAVDAVNNELQSTGAWVFGGGLEAPDTATVVDATKAGDATMTDGPYAESKDLVTGSMVIEAGSLQDAIEVARTCPTYEFEGSVEVRPVLNHRM